MKKGTITLMGVLVASALILTSCGKKAEVIVVGSGLAGHAAAYSALENGADVTWIEKNEHLGGSALVATGTFSAAGTKLQREKGIDDSVELFMKDLNRIGKGMADQDLMKLYAEEADDVWDWFMDHGLEVDERSPFIDPVHSPYSVERTNIPAKNSAFEYCKIYQQEMQQYKKNIDVLKSTEAVRLIKEDGAVRGVLTDDGKEYRADAVVLCTGGFGQNHELIEERMPKYKELRSVTLEHTDGSGILMAEEAGAQLVHMDYLVGYFGAIAQEGTKAASFGTLTSGFAERWHGDIWVDINGNRFVDEDGIDEDPRETAIDGIPEQTSFIIFDQAILEANGGKAPVRNFEGWLKDGYGVKKADTLEELADAFGINRAGLLNTVEQVNRAAKKGIDPLFGREINMPIENPPFYGIKSYGTIFMTQGGIKTSTAMEAIDRNGAHIPGLYAAGEVQGTAQWGGRGYAGGSGNTPCLVFGMKAGKSAAEYAQR